MSAGITVNTMQLRKALEPLSSMFPKGTKTVPIGLSIESGEFKIVCSQGISYVVTLTIDDMLKVEHATVLYFDITSLLVGDTETTVKFNLNSVSLRSEFFEVTLPFGYSTVDEFDLNVTNWRRVESHVYEEGIKALTTLNLNTYYMQELPMTFRGNVIMQKYPNTWVQGIASGLDMRCVISADHAKLLLRFKPEELSTESESYVAFRKSNAVLLIPYSSIVDDVPITDIISDSTTQMFVNISKYVDRLLILSKVNSKVECQVTLHESGLSTSISAENLHLATSAGDCDSNVISVFHYPLAIWLSFMKALASNTIEILLGGDILCLRSKTLVIVTRVLP